MRYYTVIAIAVCFAVMVGTAEAGVPGGKRWPEPMVLKSGTRIEKQQGGVMLHEPDKEPYFVAKNSSNTHNAKRCPDAQGWDNSFFTNSPNGVSYTIFTATWTVPPLPTKYYGNPNVVEDIIYFFNSVTSANWAEILQPVLQFNQDNRGVWQVASWYNDVNLWPMFMSTPVDVSPGDVITGIITYIEGEWLIICDVNGVAVTSFALVPDQLTFSVFPVAQLAMEIYVDNCSWLPETDSTDQSGTLIFSDVEAYDADDTFQDFAPVLFSGACNTVVSMDGTTATFTWSTIDQ